MGKTTSDPPFYARPGGGDLAEALLGQGKQTLAFRGAPASAAR